MTSVTCEYVPTNQDVELIREWLVKMPHVVQDYDDDILRTVITACKGSLQRTKAAYEKFNSLGLIYPHMFGHLDPLNETTQYFLDNAYFFRMPKKTDDGCIVLVASAKPNIEVDSNKFTTLEIPRYMFMSFFILLWENDLEESKFIFVFDCQNIKLSEIKTVTPTFLTDFFTFFTMLPVRFRGSHLINVPSFFQPVLNFTKSIINKKFADRIHFHVTLDELHDSISKKNLPKEFGGCGDDLDTLHNWWRRKVESYRDRLISENNKMRTLDHIRPKASFNGDLEGSFRKLEVD